MQGCSGSASSLKFEFSIGTSGSSCVSTPKFEFCIGTSNEPKIFQNESSLVIVSHLKRIFL